MGALVAALPVALGGTTAAAAAGSAATASAMAASAATMSATFGAASSAAAMSTVLGGAGAAGLTAGSIFSGLSAASSIAGGVASLAQGMAAKDAYAMQARQAELKGRMDAINVQEELMKTMALNDVSTAASGLKSSGTPMYAQQQSQMNANEEMRIQRLNTDIKKAESMEKAEAAGYKGLFGLAGGAATAGERIGASLYVKKKVTGQ